jgi:hypothetical protein
MRPHCTGDDECTLQIRLKAGGRGGGDGTVKQVSIKSYFAFGPLVSLSLFSEARDSIIG